MSVIVLLGIPTYLLNGQGFLLGQIVSMSMVRLTLYCVVARCAVLFTKWSRIAPWSNSFRLLLSVYALCFNW